MYLERRAYIERGMLTFDRYRIEIEGDDYVNCRQEREHVPSTTQ